MTKNNLFFFFQFNHFFYPYKHFLRIKPAVTKDDATPTAIYATDKKSFFPPN